MVRHSLSMFMHTHLYNLSDSNTDRTRPTRRTAPTAKLTDSNNAEAAELGFQRKAVQDFRMRQVQQATCNADISHVTERAVANKPSHPTSQQKRAVSPTSSSDVLLVESEDEPRPGTCLYLSCSCTHSDLNFGTAKRPRPSNGNPSELDEEGFLKDLNVQSPKDATPTREDKRRDVDMFFHPPVDKSINGTTKKYCVCKVCPYVHSLYVMAHINCLCSDKKLIINEITTLRRHLEAHHSVSTIYIQ
jgi:hypothetical protein